MLLQKVHLHNWCQHRDRLINFSPGLNAFVGPNSAGKSNVINAIVFAFTGDWSRNHGKKEANITQLIPETEPSYIEVWFTHKSTRCELVRGIRGRQSTLTLYDLSGRELERVRGDNKVTARLIELLDTNAQLLNQYVFVEQGEMFAPFSPNIKPAERINAFQRLFGIDRMEQLWDALGEQLSALPLVKAPDLAPYRQYYTDSDNLVKSLQAELLSTADLDGWSRATDPATLLIDRYNMAISNSGIFKAKRAQLKQTLQERRRLKSNHLRLTVEVQQLQNTLSQLQTQAPAAQEIIDRAKNSETASKAIALAEVSINNYITERTQHEIRLNSIEPAQFSVSGLTTLLSSAQADRLSDERFVAAFNRDSNVCPTCLQPIVHECYLRIESARNRIETNVETIQRLTSQLENLTRREALVNQLTRDISNINVKIDGMRETLAQYQKAVAACPQQTEIKDATELLALLQELVNGLNNARGESQAAANIYQQYHQLSLNLVHECRALRQSLGNTPTTAEYEAAKVTLADKDARMIGRAAVLGRYSGAVTQLTQARQNLDHALAVSIEASEKQYIHERLTEIRDVLHREKLPSQIMVQRLEEIRRHANETLAEFDAEFRLETDGLGYNANFLDGRSMPMARLSGGLRVLASLAFRIATNSHFASELGLLCLDEPTVYLDKKNILCLEPALRCLKRFSQTRGLQCIVITHESIGHLFDHVEEFTKPVA